MRFAVHGADIVGYTFNADTYCRTDIWNMFTSDVPDPDDYPTAESILDATAKLRGIDRSDESSYDSGDFPKVIFASQVESDDDRCAVCHEPLIG